MRCLTDTIAAILGEHRIDITSPIAAARCVCGAEAPGGYDDMTKHVAAVLIKGLALTQEYAIQLTNEFGTICATDPVRNWETADRASLAANLFAATRYVTRWERADE